MKGPERSAAHQAKHFIKFWQRKNMWMGAQAEDVSEKLEPVCALYRAPSRRYSSEGYA
jgi:hypothetical protein